MGGGVDVASEVASIVLLGDRPHQVQMLLSVSECLIVSPHNCLCSGAMPSEPVEFDEFNSTTCCGRQVVDALRLSRATLAKIRQNLVWAFAYNAVGIPLAAGALLPAYGIALTPSIAGWLICTKSVGGL